MIKIIYAIPVHEKREPIDKIVTEKRNKDIVFEIVERVDIAKLMTSDIENTIIIARGISYLTLSNKWMNARMVELAVNGYDVMRGIIECKELFKAKKIALVHPETILIEKDLLESIMDVQLDLFTLKDYTQVADVYKTVKRLNYDAILSGYTIYRMALRDNVNCIRMTNGYEAIKIAINEAYSIANAIIEERKKNELLEITLQNTNDGIIAMDNLGTITACNESVYRMINLPPNNSLKGKNVYDVIPILNDMQFIIDEYRESNMIKNINNKMVVINTKPIRIEGKTLGTVLILQNVDTLQKTEIDIRQKLSKKGLLAKYDFKDIIGGSEIIRKTIAIAKKYANANANVLIIGETGTGKELFAQSIHKSSNRKDQPFVAINCAALPEHLLESELFGYVDGAFTGAAKGGKVGLFELAHKGTLFLDEIAELPLGLQAKLLRVLQEREIRKLGDDRIIPVDVRIVAASNVDLQHKVKANKFRQDLLYRLDILRLAIPPLRDRKSDIKEIAELFFSAFALSENKAIRLTNEAIVELIRYDWPGNIRELKNICERLTVLCSDNQVTGEDVREIFQPHTSPRGMAPEQDYRLRAEAAVKKITQKEMAEMLGVSRTTLWRKTKQKMDA